MRIRRRILPRLELDRLATGLGFIACGVTAVDEDLLPVRRRPGFPVHSILVLAAPSLDANLDANLRLEIEDTRWFSKWIYEWLDHRSYRLCHELWQHGWHAVPTRGIPLVRAAVQAGIGSRARNGILLHPEYGPRVRLIAVLTEAHWKPDPPCVDDYCLRCDICVRRCPGQALDGGKLNRSRCIGEYDPTPEMAARQLRDEPALSPFIRLQCTECMHCCPVGKKKNLGSFTNVQ